MLRIYYIFHSYKYIVSPQVSSSRVVPYTGGQEAFGMPYNNQTIIFQNDDRRYPFLISSSCVLLALLCAHPPPLVRSDSFNNGCYHHCRRHRA